MKMTYIKGVDKVMTNLNKEINKIKKRSMEGLIEAVIMLERDMDETSPTIPIDSGDLRASFFRDPRYVVDRPIIVFGFNASYAWWVHENVGANFKRPGSGAKFLEAALKRNEKRILEIIRDTVKEK